MIVAPKPRSSQGQEAAQLDRIEQSVYALSTKMDVVIEQNEVTETQLVDLRSELSHYGHLVTGITHHLKEHTQRTNLLFSALAFLLMGLLLWIVASI